MDDPTTEQNEPSSWSDSIKPIGGLVAVGIGVFAVLTIAIVALAIGGQQAATIASSTGGVIASLVGAFFGVKVGTDQTKTAAEGERKQAAKAAVYAAHLPVDEADRVVKLAEEVARGRQP
jgi:hypothetical protein